MSRSATIPARPIHRLALLGTLALAVTLAACQDALPPLAPTDAAQAAKGGPGKPGSGEAVLFSGTRDGNADIYRMNPDGSNVRRLTTDTLNDEFPDFAPDGRTFVWARVNSAGLGELFTANADGSKQTPLTNMGTTVLHPRYSPDGTKIAFVAFSTDGGQHDIYTVNADGTGLHRLTYETSLDLSPSWSPDGTQIAFESNRSGLPLIHVMNADGLNTRQLEGCFNGACGEPAWSPDGEWIAMTVPGGAIRALNIAGKFSTPVGPLFPNGVSQHPTWSKDGTRVLFASTRGIEGTFELYAGIPGTSDPTTVRRLTVFSPGQALSPSYSH